MAFKGQVTDDEMPDNTGASLLDSLRQESAEEEAFDNVSPWIPMGDGDGLEGTVVGIGSYLDEKYNDEGKLFRTWIVKDTSGLLWQIIPFHFQLRKLMTKHRAEVGDTVAVLYIGEEISSSDPSMTFKKYRVARVAAARQRRMAARASVMTPEAFAEKS